MCFCSDIITLGIGVPFGEFIGILIDIVGVFDFLMTR